MTSLGIILEDFTYAVNKPILLVLRNWFRWLLYCSIKKCWMFTLILLYKMSVYLCLFFRDFLMLIIIYENLIKFVYFLYFRRWYLHDNRIFLIHFSHLHWYYRVTQSYKLFVDVVFFICIARLLMLFRFLFNFVFSLQHTFVVFLRCYVYLWFASYFTYSMFIVIAKVELNTGH